MKSIKSTKSRETIPLMLVNESPRAQMGNRERALGRGRSVGWRKALQYSYFSAKIRGTPKSRDTMSLSSMPINESLRAKWVTDREPREGEGGWIMSLQWLIQ
jgi:hypothetical protein